MPTTPSPLRYPGGKASMTELMGSIIRTNKLNEAYAEPYAGGAALALSLLIKGYVKEVHLNDIDYSLWAFWQLLLHQTETLIDKILSTPVTLEEWYRQSEIYKSRPNISDLGFATFFLNRTNRSGIIKAGVIGGKYQNSQYKIDSRFNKKDLIKRIAKIASHKKNIHVYNRDAIIFMKEMDSLLPDKAIFFIDPPYYLKGHQLYNNFYNEKDHIAVANTIKTLKRRWILTYDNVSEVRRLYSDQNVSSYQQNYSAAVKRRSNDLLIVPNSLYIPEQLSFSF